MLLHEFANCIVDLYVLLFLLKMSFYPFLFGMPSCDTVPVFNCKLLGAETVLSQKT